jgi:hypothetical protein
MKGKLQQGNSQHKIKAYELREDGILLYKDKVYVPNFKDLKNMVPREIHNVPYARNPCYQTTITTVKK